MIKEKISNEKGIFTIGITDIIGTGVSSVFWLYIASVIDPGDYGEIHYFLGIAAIAQIISMFGNPNVLTVSSAKKENIQSALYMLSLIPTIISSVSIIFIFNRVDASVLVIGYVVHQSVNSVILGRKFYKKYAKMILIQKSLTIILGISFFYVIGPTGIIIALALTFIPHFSIFIKEFKNQKINFSFLKIKKNFLINNYLMSISGSFGGQIDKIILGQLLGFTLLGNYSLALQIFAILIMVSTISFKYLLPHDATGISKKKIKKIIILISITISLSGYFLLPKLIPIFFPKFIETVDAIGIISLAVLPETITMLYTSKILGQEKSSSILIAKLISLFTIIIGFILFGPIFGISGLALIVVLASSIQAGFFMVSNKIQKFN